MAMPRCPVEKGASSDPTLVGRDVIYGDAPTLETLYLMLDAFAARQEATA